MAIYFGIIFGFYFLLMVALWIGWLKAQRNRPGITDSMDFISVVIAMRNEQGNLKQLFGSLSKIDYAQSNFEVIVVDDHSTDGSAQELKHIQQGLSNLKVTLAPNEGHGKKAALAHGIGLAKGSIIATTDADCVVPENWLARINECFRRKSVKMAIGSVRLENEGRMFSQLQSMEFASVIGTGISLCALGKPTMCNGANLAFCKEAFVEVKGYQGNEHIASGDDEFLMRKIETRFPGSVSIVSLDSVVTTRPQETLKDFFQQRLRWASKWKANSSRFARFLAVFMLITQLSWLALLIWMGIQWHMLGIAIFVLKLIVDLVFLLGVSQSLKIKFQPAAFVLLQFLYPVYVVSVGILSQVKNHNWKGRRI